MWYVCVCVCVCVHTRVKGLLVWLFFFGHEDAKESWHHCHSNSQYFFLSTSLLAGLLLVCVAFPSFSLSLQSPQTLDLLTASS